MNLNLYYFEQNSINQLIQTSSQDSALNKIYFPQSNPLFKNKESRSPTVENTQMKVLLAFEVQIFGTVAAVLQDSITLEGGSGYLGRYI